MARLITKGLIGQQDLSLGTGTFTRATSTGGTQTLNQIAGFFNVGLVVPTGAVNGINTVFTLPTTPVNSVALVFRNGLLQNPGGGNDYTISGGTITFNTAPLVGDTIISVY
jgi:hypothetical protein